tara:strand:+ start:985 stop:1548 length:564 start_codon:yes stop_codon:yes gene_type:complete
MYSNKYNRVTKLNRSEIKIFNKTDSNPTYGELKKSGFIQLTSYLPNNLKSFCDLGSGIGIVVKYVADLTKHFTTIHGVELSEERYQVSLNLMRTIKNKVRKKQVKIFHDNILSFDISKYDVLYISNLCFNHNFNKRLANKLDKECKTNCIIFASQDLIIERNHIKKQFPIDQSWGKNTQMFRYELIE